MSTETTIESLSGTTVGSYALRDVVGKGGMGVVYKAHHSVLDREVCVKFLSAELGRHEKFRQQFEREARTLAKLSHPNVLTIHDMGTHGDACYLVTEYVRGGNLLDLRRRRSLGREELAGIVLGIGRGVAYVHRSGFLHRDLKPSNILVSESGDVKLVDFGIAMETAGQGAMKPTGSPGTLRFCAPEIIVGQPYDQKADQFSLAMTLFVFMAGNYPECGKKASELSSILPPAVDAVLERAMSLQPSVRFESVEKFCCSLLAGLLGLSEVPATLSRCPVPESDFHHGNLTPAIDSTTPPTASPIPLLGGGITPAPRASASAPAAASVSLPPPARNASARRWGAIAVAAVAGVLLAGSALAYLLASGGSHRATAMAEPESAPVAAVASMAAEPDALETAQAVGHPVAPVEATVATARPTIAAATPWQAAGRVSIASEPFSFLASGDGSTLYAATFHNGPPNSGKKAIPLYRVSGIAQGTPVARVFHQREFAPQQGYSGVAVSPETGDVYISIDAGEGKQGTVLCLDGSGQPRAGFGQLGILTLSKRSLGVAVAGGRLLVLVDWADVLVLDAATGRPDGLPLTAGQRLLLRDVAYDAQRDRVLAAGAGVLATWRLQSRQFEGAATLEENAVPRSMEGLTMDPGTGRAVVCLPSAVLEAAGRGAHVHVGNDPAMFLHAADAATIGWDTLVVSDLKGKCLHLFKRPGPAPQVAQAAPPSTPAWAPAPAAVPTQTPSPTPPPIIATSPATSPIITTAAVGQNVGQTVVLSGTVQSVRDSWSERAPNIMVLDDGIGTVDVVFWKDTRAGMDAGLLQPGTVVVLAGKATEFRGRPQVQLGGSAAIVRSIPTRINEQAIAVQATAAAFAASQPGQ